MVCVLMTTRNRVERGCSYMYLESGYGLQQSCTSNGLNGLNGLNVLVLPELGNSETRKRSESCLEAQWRISPACFTLSP